MFPFVSTLCIHVVIFSFNNEVTTTIDHNTVCAVLENCDIFIVKLIHIRLCFTFNCINTNECQYCNILYSVTIAKTVCWFCFCTN